MHAMDNSINPCNVRAGSEEDNHPFNVAINIEGKTFLTSEETSKSIPGSLLSSLNKDSKYYNKTTDAFCFDRDSSLFSHILAAHRAGEVHVPQDVCAIRFRKEMEFWRIPKSLIAPCCWNYYYSTCGDVEVLTHICKTFPKETFSGSNIIQQMLNLNRLIGNDKGLPDEKPSEQATETGESSFRNKLWLFLDEPRSSRAAMIWCFIFGTMAAISVVLNLIWLEKTVRVDPYLVPYEIEKKLEQQHGNITLNDKIERLILTDPHIAMLTMDCVCALFFALEVLVHFTVCPNKIRYFHDWHNVVKVLLSFCMVYSTVFEIRKDWLFEDTVAIVWFWIKSMNTMRVLLIFKFYKISSILNVVFLVFLNCKKELYLLLGLFFLMVVMYGGLIFAFEMDSDMFPDTTRAMWWALITMTTIGYGDFHPTRPMGYIIGIVCAVEGVVLIALPIAMIASKYAKYRDTNDDLQNHLEQVKQETIERERKNVIEEETDMTDNDVAE